MSKIIKKRDAGIENLSKNLNFNISNSNNIKNSEIKTINTDDKNAYIEKNSYTNDVLENIIELFGFDKPTIDDGHELLRDNSIWYSKDEIKSVEKRGPNNENIIVIMNNGEEFVFVPNSDGDGYILNNIILSDGTSISCALPESRQQEIRELAEIDDEVPIKGWASIEIDGHQTYVYWVGDASCDFEVFKAQVGNVKKALDRMPNNVLEQIFSNNNFKGFFVGAYYSSSYSENDYNAFAFQDNYIYINTHQNASYETILHELGHIYDFTIGDGNIHYSVSSSTINQYYSKYGEVIKDLIPTNSGYHFTGPTNSTEFFACVFQIYLVKPEELKQLVPELYIFMDGLVKNT